MHAFQEEITDAAAHGASKLRGDSDDAVPPFKWYEILLFVVAAYGFLDFITGKKIALWIADHLGGLMVNTGLSLTWTSVLIVLPSQIWGACALAFYILRRRNIKKFKQKTGA